MRRIIIIQLIFIFIIGVGWVQNIKKLSDCDFKAPYKAEVIHGIGIFPPIGMVTGWLVVGK